MYNIAKLIRAASKGLAGRGAGEVLFIGYKISVTQMEKS